LSEREGEWSSGATLGCAFAAAHAVRQLAHPPGACSGIYQPAVSAFIAAETRSSALICDKSRKQALSLSVHTTKNNELAGQTQEGFFWQLKLFQNKYTQGKKCSNKIKNTRY
jgi:hypothetical protein